MQILFYFIDYFPLATISNWQKQRRLNLKKNGVSAPPHLYRLPSDYNGLLGFVVFACSVSFVFEFGVVGRRFRTELARATSFSSCRQREQDRVIAYIKNVTSKNLLLLHQLKPDTREKINATKENKWNIGLLTKRIEIN